MKMDNFKTDFSQKIFIVDKWLADKNLAERKREHFLIEKETISLLEEAMDFQNLFFDGKYFL